jgi:hypothetical protein
MTAHTLVLSIVTRIHLLELFVFLRCDPFFRVREHVQIGGEGQMVVNLVVRKGSRSGEKWEEKGVSKTGERRRK